MVGVVLAHDHPQPGLTQLVEVTGQAVDVGVAEDLVLNELGFATGVVRLIEPLGEEEGVFDDFLQEFQPNYPILLVDVFSPPEPFGAPKVLPTTVLLDPRGHAVKGFVGPVTRAQLEAFIDRVPSP